MFINLKHCPERSFMGSPETLQGYYKKTGTFHYCSKLMIFFVGHYLQSLSLKGIGEQKGQINAIFC